ncbi:MAG: DUF1566 domain-containing protein [Proteobacteria bacterium]|nr:DUF1566 domain-containing protein [Pseudomonadota bacterium]
MGTITKMKRSAAVLFRILCLCLGFLTSTGCGDTKDDETSGGTTITAVPTNSAAALSFADTDPDDGQISGNIVVAKAGNESDLTHYVLYWGSNATTKLNDQPAMATLAKTGGDPTYTLPENTPVLSGAAYFLVFSRNNHGEMETGTSTKIEDVRLAVSTQTSPVPDTGQTASFTDTFGEDHDITTDAPSYTINDDETTTDDVTGLTWQREDDGLERNRQEAAAYCDGLDLGGYSEWRLPTITELQDIADYGRTHPAIDDGVFPNTQSWYYWSSTPDANNPAYTWPMGFAFGISGDYLRIDSYYVRCVRGH